jgi:hypothetical protein
LIGTYLRVLDLEVQDVKIPHNTANDKAGNTGSRNIVKVFRERKMTSSSLW